MARIRNNLRTSSRWGGSGAEYDRGYQYNVPDRIPLIFGPFKRIWPQGERNTPLDTLQLLEDGVIRDNVVYPIWLRQNSTVADRVILQAGEYGLIPTLFKVEFYQDLADDFIKAAYTDGTNSGVDASTFTSGGQPIQTAPWQKYIYFGNEYLANIRRYSPVDNAFTTVAGAPTPKFLFFLDNNLVALYKSGNSWLAHWSVDSLPEDWTGAGSGFAPIPGSIGEVKGYGYQGDNAVIIGSRGAVIMQPTGSASPAFRFDRITTIRGTPYESVIGVGDVVYFTDFERRLVYYDGNSVQPVSAGVPFFSDGPVFYPSARTGLLFVCNPSEDMTYLLNTTFQEWTALLEGSYDFFSDSPHTHDAGYVFGYKNTVTGHDLVSLDLDPAVYTQPKLETGRYDLFTEMYVDYVSVVRTSITSPIPTLRVLRQLSDGTIEISAYETSDGIEQGTQVIFNINAYAQFIEVQFGTPLFEGPFLITDPDANGNFTTNITNPQGYYRADTDVNGNFAISEEATEWEGDSVDADGNFTLVAPDPIVEDRWNEDSGVEYIRVMLQKESNEPTAVG